MYYLQEFPSLKNEDIATLIRERCPDAKTTRECVAWYRHQLKPRTAA